MKRKHLAWAVAAAALLAACDTPLDTDPTASIDAGDALTTPRGVELAVNGAYRSLQGAGLYGRTLTAFPDLYADNLNFTGTFQTDREVSLRNIPSTNGAILDTWTAAYAGINRANNVLAAIPGVSALTAAQAAEYRGAALFIRSLHYFNLLRYFGGVPIVTTPSSGVGPEALGPRATAAEVYARIVADLEEAAGLLPAGRVNGRATRAAANALLARVYLDDGKHAQARDKASAVIGSGTFSLVTDYRALFTNKNSAESIFELQYSLNNSNSQAFFFLPQSLGGRYGYAPTNDLFNAYEAGDPRRAASICGTGSSRHACKYFRAANSDDNVIVLRLAEMYLIRAEANARLDADPAVVRADIDIVRQRAGLGVLPVTVDTQAELLDAVLKERRVELAFEGHRFFDLRRMGRAVEILAIPAERLLWPIPQSERDVNPSLSQNPGY